MGRVRSRRFGRCSSSLKGSDVSSHGWNPWRQATYEFADPEGVEPTRNAMRGCVRPLQGRSLARTVTTGSTRGYSHCSPSGNRGTRLPGPIGRRFRRLVPETVRSVIALACLLLVASGAFGSESFDKRLAKANKTLENGDPDGALTMYRDLQTEDPESEALYYSMGCAEYKQGSKLVEYKAPRDAVESFKTAKESFEKTLNARDPEIRRNARYDHANATAQIAINSIGAQQYEESKKAFEESVREYEDLLKQYPDMTAARQNLDHMRYLLKSMLQNPPPPQQQQHGQGENKQDPNQQQQDQQQGKDQQEQGEEQKKEEEGQDNQEQNPDQKQGETKAAMCDKDQQEQPEGQQNVEAILQSLEDVDKRAQKETKNTRTGIEIRKDWW